MQDGSPSEIYIGLMSGTSLDGIDIAIVDFAQHPPELIYCATEPYQPDLRQRICEITQTPTTSLNDLCQLDVELGASYADFVNRSLDLANIQPPDVYAIGNHGQTIRHSPGTSQPYTLQIGDPNVIVAKTGITSVADFRRRDVALGGQGAPLAPAFHRFMFNSDTTNRAIINIGGIANITCLPAAADASVIGFDTGPGNTLLDYWISQHGDSCFDEQGKWAETGCVINELLDSMLDNEAYFQQPPPKSTGTEFFNSNWLSPYLNPDFDAANVQATLVELTAVTISRAVSRLPSVPSECYICGGGVHNLYLIKRLQQHLPDCQIRSTDYLGLNPDYVEAVAFAWLAQQSLNQRAGNLPGVTQARNEAILGGIYFK